MKHGQLGAKIAGQADGGIDRLVREPGTVRGNQYVLEHRNSLRWLWQTCRWRQRGETLFLNFPRRLKYSPRRGPLH
jgi:hypothetical protein